MSLSTIYTGDRLSVAVGRVTEIDLGVRAVRALTDPDGGNATVNADGTLAVILPDLDQRGDTSFKVLVEEGGNQREITVDLKATAGSEGAGWGAGEFYTLETKDGSTVIEPGENHRKVYVTESKSALGLSDIAAREKISVNAIDGEWLAAHPEYGATEGMALDTEAGMSLWYELTGRYTEPGSQWLLFEKGYRYEGTDRIIDRGTIGESELHPVLVGTWGKGDTPVIEDRWSLFQEGSRNIVFQGLDFAQGGSIVGSGTNVILEDVILRDNASVIQGADRITLRNSQILDASDNIKTNGLYATRSEGLLIENVLADHNGWEEGWETGDGNAPNAFNHNIYIQWNNFDVTFRDNVSMRGSSFGAQIRSGGVVENNAFLDNNIALNVKGGNYRDGNYSGNYSLILDNVVSSGAHKDSVKSGALAWGVQNLAPDTSLIGNIIAHLADPADPDELAEKTSSPREPLKNKFDPFVDDTIIYRWVTENLRDDRLFQTDANVPDIAESVLDKVTLRTFLADELGKNPDDVVAALAEWLRDNWSSVEGASEIVQFFQNGFEIDSGIRSDTQTLRFEPDVRGDGIRWDNRLNWSTDDLPIDGDDVDLSGNWVSFSGTTSIGALGLGDGGRLTVSQGRLNVADLEAGNDAALQIGRAGQVWVKGYDGTETVEIVVDGGRFANTGSFSGPTDMTVTGGEVLLATSKASFDLDGRLSISGRAAKVGFDGPSGSAVLSLAAGSELAIAPDAKGISAIREFRSGAWGASGPSVSSAIDLGRGDTLLTLDLDALAIGNQANGMVLASADMLTGGFGTIAVDGAQADDVTLRIDYGTDRLELIAVSGAGGATSLVLAGSDETDVFVAAANTATRIEAYEKSDSIDLSASLASDDLGNLVLSSAGGQAAILDGSGDVLARFGGAPDEVRVRADGWEVVLDAGGAGAARKLPDAGPIVPPAEGAGEDDGVPPGETPESPDADPAPIPNAAPAAEDLGLEGEADQVLTGQLSATDADGDPLVFTLGAAPAAGQVFLSDDGSFRYDPQGAYDDLPAGEARTVSFEYSVSDGRGGLDTGSVSLVLEGVSGPQDAPAPGQPDEPADSDAPDGDAAPDPVDTPDKIEWNEITGTDGLDLIEGTLGSDLIRSAGGRYDRLYGYEGPDAFVVGALADNGVRSTDQIRDFDVTEDILVLEDGATISRIDEREDSVMITLAGDFDNVLLDNAQMEAVELLQVDGTWLG